MKLKRYDVKSLYRDSRIRRYLLCEGTRISMLREDIVVPIEMIYQMYDEFQSKGLKLPDGYYYET